ncbi:hypothetical protein [Thioalkalivibrio sp. XN279]|uniref:hypothetical protein n=1 Tax=Thioalkalivibrio sp. XN279 TaxID=2714953 RepID=UPI00140D07F6|nr:hypothetical protein [Thioalkalivibrio sp. XN279]NHA14676.1 hypothetical protein [Thioalkalivibrio sp. XN279]
MRTKTAWILASLLLAPLAAAQEVSRLEISKPPGGAEALTRIDLYLPADVSSLDFNNPINGERTRLAVAKDDAGGDLLAAHDAVNAEWVAQGYEVESPVSFAGIGDYANNKDVNIGIVLKVAPTSGAKAITIEGTVALNFIDTSSAKKATLKAIPTETAWGSPGVDTPIGPVRIEPASSMFMDDVIYQGYQVMSPNAPVIAVTVVGGDASEEANSMGMGLEPGMFVIKGDAPQTVDLNVTYASTETKEIPFKLTFGVGL